MEHVHFLVTMYRKLSDKLHPSAEGLFDRIWMFNEKATQMCGHGMDAPCNHVETAERWF